MGRSSHLTSIIQASLSIFSDIRKELDPTADAGVAAKTERRLVELLFMNSEMALYALIAIAALIYRDGPVFRVWDTSPKGKAVHVGGKLTREAELRDGDVIHVSGRAVRFYKGLPTLGDDTHESRDVLRRSGESRRGGKA